MSLGERRARLEGRAPAAGRRAEAARGPQRRERDGRRRRGAGERDAPRRRRRGAAQLRGGPAPARARPRARRRRSASTTRRRPTSAPRSPAIEAFDGGVHLIAGGSVKGESFDGLAGAVAERARSVHLIGEAADADRRGAWPTPASPIHRDGTLEGAVASAAAAARRPARSSCSRPRARASTSSATTRSAASASASWWRRSDEPREGRGRQATDRVPAAADRDPLPARPRRGDGLQRQLRDLACSTRPAGAASST